MIIRKKDEYVVEGLGRVSVYTALDKEAAIKEQQPETIYEGFSVITAPVSGQMAQFPIEFFIDASSLDDAFGQFQERAATRFREMVEEAKKAREDQQKQIIVPPAGVRLD